MRYVGWACVSLLVLACGCGSAETKKAKAFHASLVAANERLDQAGRAFFEKVTAQVSTGFKDEGSLREAVIHLEKTLAQVKSEMAGLAVPARPSARKLFDAHQAFLQVEESCLQEIRELVRRVTKDGTDADVEGLTQRMMRKESQALANVRTAEQEFASDYRFKLMNK